MWKLRAGLHCYRFIPREGDWLLTCYSEKPHDQPSAFLESRTREQPKTAAGELQFIWGKGFPERGGGHCGSCWPAADSVVQASVRWMVAESQSLGTEKGSEEVPWWLSWWRIRLQCRRPRFNSWVRKILWRRDRLPTPVFLDFPHGSAGEETAWNVGDLGSLPGLGRSPGEGNGYPLQYSDLENSIESMESIEPGVYSSIENYEVHGVTNWATFISLVIQWLRLRICNISGLALIPGQGTRSHMPKLKVPRAPTKTWCNQINDKYF